jgi:flagellar motor switch protein FliG
MAPVAETSSALSAVTGQRKAAILLVTLGPVAAAEVFRHLEEQEIERLSLEMAQVERVSPDVAGAVYDEVAETAAAFEYVAEGGVEFAREVLDKSLGAERAEEIISRLAAMIEMRPFEFLRRTPPDQIAAFLAKESAQTIALTVANLSKSLAAQVLAQLPGERQVEVARRIALMNETSPEVIRDVEDVIRTKLSSVVSQEYAAAGGVKSLADILNNADRSTERKVLETLTETDSELAEEVRMLLFVFEDVVKLDDRSLQTVLREVDSKDLALALRGAGEEVKEKITGNLSQRAAEMLKEEMDYMPPQKRSAIEEAQGRIVAAVRRLEDAGVIELHRGDPAEGGDDDVLV